MQILPIYAGRNPRTTILKNYGALIGKGEITGGGGKGGSYCLGDGELSTLNPHF